MSLGLLQTSILSTAMTLALGFGALAQQNTGAVQGNAGRASQPAGVNNGAGTPAANINGGSPAASDTVSTTPKGGQPTPAVDTAAPRTDTTSPATDKSTPTTDDAAPKTGSSVPNTDGNTPRDDQPRTITAEDSGDPNAYNPILEPPPLPKGKPTLIGGTATRIDHVRNLLTIEPFGSNQKVKVFLDERTQIYRNGEATTVLGIRKGDRVYVDTMLDGSRVFAKNVRVQNQTGVAEVRGQVTGVNQAKGTVTVRDELSAQPVTFGIGGGTQYRAYKGTASSSDLQPGSLVDVQFAPGKDKHDIAKEIVLLARPGDAYVFSGVVTHLDMRTGTLALENRSDDQTYELHFSRSAVDDRSKLKVGSEVTAHAVFNGRQYTANDLQLSVPNGDESKRQ